MLKKLNKGKRVRTTFIGFITIVLLVNLFCAKASADENVVEEVKSILGNYYINNVSNNVLNKDSVSDILTNLNDPYTQVMNQDQYDSIVNNTFYGIGVTIEIIDVGAKITSVMVNSPAMKAGLREEDIIIVADDNYLSRLSVKDSLKILNGKPGVQSTLKVLKKNEMAVINITPDIVYYPTIYSKLVNTDTAYFQILSFGVNTLDEFKYKLNLPEMKYVDRYIIDLRNNPGGYIYSAVELAGYFAKNQVVAVFQTKNGEKFNFKAVNRNNIIDKSTAFLVNEYTASAAELLVACAQDNGTAIILGEKTFGKGTAQSTFKLSDGTIFKTTTLKFYSPTERDISKGGLVPDVQIKEMDPFFAGDLLTASESRYAENSRIAKVVINTKVYYVDIDKIKDKNYLEAYRQIISQATSIDVSSYSQLNKKTNAIKNNYPVLKYAEVPRTKYNLGDRITFKFSSPNYNGLVQYRAMLWDEVRNQYLDLWNTKDRYYEKWRPRGKDVFSISFPATKPGNYKIKVFVKRNGILNLRGELKGMNCDSYVYEIPYIVGAN